MVILDEDKQIIDLREMVINSSKGLPSSVENSIYYPKLKHLLYNEIIRFTKDRVELRDELHFLRLNIGEPLGEDDIREYLDNLKIKYNNQDTNTGIEYHIEATRVDLGVSVFVVLKRDIIYMKKFVFRFKKASPSTGVIGLSASGLLLKESDEEKQERLSKLMK